VKAEHKPKQLTIPYSVSIRVQAPDEDSSHTESIHFAWAARRSAGVSTHTIFEEAMTGGKWSECDSKFFFADLLPKVLKRKFLKQLQSRKLVEEVEDAIALTVAKIHNKLDELRYPAAANAIASWQEWAWNAYLDSLRRITRQQRLEDEFRKTATKQMFGKEDNEAERQQSIRDAREKVAVVFCKMRQEDRELLWRKYGQEIADVTYHALARDLGETGPSAEQRIQRRESRAVERLAGMIDADTALALLSISPSDRKYVEDDLQKLRNFFLLGGAASADGSCDIPNAAIRELARDILKHGTWSGAGRNALLIYPPI
jgi:hypothetical protein